MAPALKVAVTLEQCWHPIPGGTARAALDSVRALQAHSGIDMVGVSALHRRGPLPAWRPSIPVEALPLPRVALYEAWHRLRVPRVELATGRIDVIHATGMAVPPRSAPLVVTVNDLVFLREPTLSTRRGLRFFERSVELARMHADLITVPSLATLEDCVANGFDPRRLRLVPLGVDAPAVDETEVARVRSQFGLEAPYVLWVGTIEPRKNLPRLIEAFASIGSGDVELVLAGPKGWNEDLDRLIAPLRDRVHVLGFVTGDELRALYAGAHVFAMPSSYEGFGLPVLEAMAQGAPVVTSRHTATAEVLGDAGVLVDPMDVDSIASGLETLIVDRGRALELGAAARRRAETFSWERTAAALEAVYVEAAAL